MNTSWRPLRKKLEILGTLLLLFTVWHERQLLGRSWDVLLNSNLLLLAFCLMLAWLTYAWSALNYKLLIPKIKFKDVYLAHLAASGPGRIIPGGAGHISFGVLFLQKQGISLSRATATAITSNAIGFAVNFLVLVIIFITKNELLISIRLSTSRVMFLIGTVFALLLIALLLQAGRSTKKPVNQTKKAFLEIVFKRLKNPLVFSQLIALSIAAIVTNSLILYFASHATGLQVTFIQAVIIMSFGVAVGSLLPTPGGIGGIEAGFITTLSLLGYDTANATAAALLYRIATYFVPLLFGTASYVYLRKRNLL